MGGNDLVNTTWHMPGPVLVRRRSGVTRVGKKKEPLPPTRLAAFPMPPAPPGTPRPFRVAVLQPSAEFLFAPNGHRCPPMREDDLADLALDSFRKGGWRAWVLPPARAAGTLEHGRA